MRPAAELCFAVVVALLSLLGGSISLLLAPTGLGRSGFCLRLSLGLADLLQQTFPTLQLLR